MPCRSRSVSGLTPDSSARLGRWWTKTRIVRFARTAERHFLEAIDFVRQENRRAAVSFRDRAPKSLDRLQDFPESGRRLPEFSDLPYREVVVPPYRFFYRIKENTVWIVDVWHDAQLAEAP
ncbi:MAG: type II toxin-antitoxin system RelE/ParE family toxin [Rhodothermales bacterium]